MQIHETTVASHLEKAIALSGKTQREIAAKVGYANPNVISMMKQGQTKVPIEKIPALAAATGTAPGPFLALALKEYMPEAWNVLAAHPEIFRSESSLTSAGISPPSPAAVSFPDCSGEMPAEGPAQRVVTK